MNREQTISLLKRKVEALQPEYDKAAATYNAAVKEYIAAASELERAGRAYYIGERVCFEQTCKRGCCVEFGGIGVIRATKGSYYEISLEKSFEPNVKYDPDKLYTISSFDIKKLEP